MIYYTARVVIKFIADIQGGPKVSNLNLAKIVHPLNAAYRSTGRSDPAKKQMGISFRRTAKEYSIYTAGEKLQTTTSIGQILNF